MEGFMKKLFAVIPLILAMVCPVFANDHSADYKMGTFISAASAPDGTITSTLHGDGTTRISFFASSFLPAPMNPSRTQLRLEGWRIGCSRSSYH
jgi:hypothetical protein